MAAGWHGDPERWLLEFERNPLLVWELDACEKIGIRHSRFIEWDPADQAKAVAKLMWEAREKAETCMSCMTKTKAWYDEDGRNVEPPPYIVEIENCQGCNVKGREQKKIDALEHADPGLRAVMRPNTDGIQPNLTI